MATKYPQSLTNLYLRAITGEFPDQIQIGQKIIFTGNLYKISNNEQENIKFNFPGPMPHDGTFYLTYTIVDIIDKNNINVNIKINLRFNSLNYEFNKNNRPIKINGNRIGIYNHNLFTHDSSYKLNVDAKSISLGQENAQWFHAILRVVDISKKGGYYEKYMKYKNKYIELKNFIQKGSGSKLESALSSNDKEKIKKLIEEGEDINKVDLFGPLICKAITYLNADIIKIFLEHNVKINDLPKETNALLCLLSNASSDINDENAFKITKLLVENGVNLNEKNFQGMTALHYAVQKGFSSVVKLLLDKGANPNITSNGDSILQTAYFSYPVGHRDKMVEFLKSYGAKWDIN